jgi:hypothetical protein
MGTASDRQTHAIETSIGAYHADGRTRGKPRRDAAAPAGLPLGPTERTPAPPRRVRRPPPSRAGRPLV